MLCLCFRVNPPDWHLADWHQPTLCINCILTYCVLAASITLCVWLRHSMKHFILQGDELGYSGSFSLHISALDVQGVCKPSWGWGWACTFVLEWVAQQSECKALLGLGDRAEATDLAALEAVLNCSATCVVDGSNFGTTPKCKVK